ncbi:MAG: peptidase S41 [Deltaproteobacteria bacterium CG11_big_fil_rev_8_21_14_0_20_47_16]|nr:MAG: peptidase S41 [Deltaproteobacteria bacterium CG11_big_fil_rev_8_21_14_0_20_47_16]
MLSAAAMMRKILIVVLCSAMTTPAWALSDKGYQTLHTFSRVLQQVETNYVEPVNDQILLRGAIRGMMDVLDPHSVFMSPAVYKELRMETGGRFAGVGLEVTIKKGLITIVSPIEGSPADHAGIKAGDRIIKINGKSTRDVDLGEAIGMMRGRSGSQVTLTLQRDENKHPFDVTLRRKVIQVPSIRAELLPDRIGYARITSFQERTGADLADALHDMEKNGSLNGLILDLRNNPGGLLDQAVDVSDLFLSAGTIVTTESRRQEIDRRIATGEGTEPGYPIIILINGGSASASEIVAGALQDNGRALLMGTQSFGKGSVQSVMELDDGSALKLTIARYFTPSGRSIQAQGITPDVLVGDTPGKAPVRRNFRESALRHHLESKNEKSSSEPVEPVMLSEEEEPVASSTLDYQKSKAQEVLIQWIQKHPKESLNAAKFNKAFKKKIK